MIDYTKVLKSRKKIGRHEKQIIETLSDYFRKIGYDVLPHSRFDIAWGSILSDIDLLLIKNDTLTLVEVKSSKDNLSRVKKQFKEIQDYVDYFYIATDYYPKKWPLDNTGRIVVKDGTIDFLKMPEKIEQIPTVYSIMSLKKSDLTTMLGLQKHQTNRTTKYVMATQLQREVKGTDLKHMLKTAVTCNLKHNQNS